MSTNSTTIKTAILLICVSVPIIAQAREHATGFIFRNLPDSLVFDGRKLARVATLPDSFNWANVSGVNYLGAIKNQQSCGSCYAFASIAQLESCIRFFSKNNSWLLDFSEQEIVSCDTTSYACEGGFFPVEYLKRLGVTDEACFPYRTAQTIYWHPSCDSACDDIAVRRLWKLDVQPTDITHSLDIIKNLVSRAPAFFGLILYESFYELEGVSADYVWKPNIADPTDVPAGGHAMLCVGWNDAQQCLIFQNSWGPEFGHNGFVKIHYDCFSLSYPKHVYANPDSYYTYMYPTQAVRAKSTFVYSTPTGLLAPVDTFLPIYADSLTRIAHAQPFSLGNKWYYITGYTAQKMRPDTTITYSGSGNSFTVVLDAPLNVTWVVSETTAFAQDCLDDKTILAYPNPFDARTKELTISFKLCEPAEASIQIYDAAYNFVRELMEPTIFLAQNVNTSWDGKNSDGEIVAPGVYFLVVRTDEKTATAKIVVTRR